MAAVLYSEGRVFAARRLPGGDLGGKWELPGGKTEAGESDAEALAREFLEEFGSRIRVLRFLGETIFEHRGRTRSLAAYLVELEDGEKPELREHSECRWLDPAELAGLDLADSDRKLLPLIAVLGRKRR